MAARSVIEACTAAELAAIVAHERGHLHCPRQLQAIAHGLRARRAALDAAVHQQIAAAWHDAAEDAADDAATRGDAASRVDLAALLMKIARLTPATGRGPPRLSARSLSRTGSIAASGDCWRVKRRHDAPHMVRWHPSRRRPAAPRHYARHRALRRSSGSTTSSKPSSRSAASRDGPSTTAAGSNQRRIRIVVRDAHCGLASWLYSVSVRRQPWPSAAAWSIRMAGPWRTRPSRSSAGPAKRSPIKDGRFVLQPDPPRTFRDSRHRRGGHLLAADPDRGSRPRGRAAGDGRADSERVGHSFRIRAEH